METNKVARELIADFYATEEQLLDRLMDCIPNSIPTIRSVNCPSKKFKVYVTVEEIKPE